MIPIVTGCAFLTYFSRDSAAMAQHALHEKRTLPGVSFIYFNNNFFIFIDFFNINTFQNVYKYIFLNLEYVVLKTFIFKGKLNNYLFWIHNPN